MKVYGAKNTTVEKEVVLHCSRCKTTIDENQPGQAGWGNALIYLTQDWEYLPTKKSYDYPKDAVEFWLRPTSVPHNQHILCYVCTETLRRFLDGLST